MIISSQQNPIFKLLRSLITTKGIKEHGRCLLSGHKVTNEWIKNNPKSDFYWIMRPDQTLPDGHFENTVTLARELYSVLDEFGSNFPLLCIAVPKILEISELRAEKPAIYCTVGDPANMGAILRSCYAFGVKQVVLLEESCHPFLPKSLRSSSGYAFHLEYFKGPSARDLTSNDIVALDMKGSPIWDSPLNKNLQFLIGEEGQGVPRTFTGKRISIPMQPEVESLNVAVAASLMLFEWKRQNPQ